MVVAVAVREDAIRVWSREDDEVTVERDPDYGPTCYVGGPPDALADLRARLAADPKVERLGVEAWRTSLRADEPADVLCVDLERPGEERALAREVRCVHEPDGWAPGTFRLYNVDLAPKFRYCLETGTRPVPTGWGRSDRSAASPVRTLSLSIPEHALAARDLTALTCDGDSLGETEPAVLHALAARLREREPDALVLDSADLVPLVHERADALGVDCHLGRRPGHQLLAGANTYESYGRVGHSPSRYDVPGRAIIDRSNSFLWGVAGVAGLLDLVERSWRPLQETAWGSIGTIFTAIQIRRASERGVLVPWRAWAAEAFKTARTLHDADRGGFTFEPAVGFHEDVVEVDFSSLYPRIMIEHNLSPETVRCDCHDADDVPGLGYSVCPDVAEGFVPSVLSDIVADRAEYKAAMRATDDPAERERLADRADALKWILVTCFGYQGYRNSKFGRIECHEAINAYAREILLDAKAVLEAAGWRVLHGIVDSLWITPRTDDHDPVEAVTERVTEVAGIPLEHENDFEWVCFVPRRDGRAGALTRYFGRVADAEGSGDSDGGASADGGAGAEPEPSADGNGSDVGDDMDDYKIRGIEARQRSTPPFVADVQRDLIRALDRHREPAPVCDRLARHLARLRSGAVEPAALVVRTSVSRELAEYGQRSRTVAAMERYRDHGMDRAPGQDVRYVVVDDDARSRDRVRLAFEEPERYDADFYADLLCRATESVLSPLGWDRARIERELRDTRDARLSAFE